MFSARTRKELPGLCLLLLGLIFCVIGVSGAAHLSAPDTYSVAETDNSIQAYEDLSEDAQQIIDNGTGRQAGTVTVDEMPEDFRAEEWNFVRNDDAYLCLFFENRSNEYVVTEFGCKGLAFVYNNLSERGQVFFSAALDSPDQSVSVHQEPPQEFSAMSFEAGRPVKEQKTGPGYYYIFKNDTVYEFTVSTSGLNLGPIFFVGGGFVLGWIGLASWGLGWVRAPLPVLAGASTFVVWPLLRALVEVAGFLSLAIWWEQQPQFLVAGALFVLTAIGVVIHTAASEKEGNRKRRRRVR
ncbi:MAG: hypothetical protein V5A41_07320 [Haloarculaceae archaeon]